jgi:hypothetical protein
MNKTGSSTMTLKPKRPSQVKSSTTSDRHYRSAHVNFAKLDPEDTKNYAQKNPLKLFFSINYKSAFDVIK